jgi:hypothetical protein
MFQDFSIGIVGAQFESCYYVHFFPEDKYKHINNDFYGNHSYNFF